jgi:hypothetical protein
MKITRITMNVKKLGIALIVKTAICAPPKSTNSPTTRKTGIRTATSGAADGLGGWGGVSPCGGSVVVLSAGGGGGTGTSASGVDT